MRESSTLLDFTKYPAGMIVWVLVLLLTSQYLVFLNFLFHSCISFTLLNLSVITSEAKYHFICLLDLSSFSHLFLLIACSYLLPIFPVLSLFSLMMLSNHSIFWIWTLCWLYALPVFYSSLWLVFQLFSKMSLNKQKTSFYLEIISNLQKAAKVRIVESYLHLLSWFIYLNFASLAFLIICVLAPFLFMYMYIYIWMYVYVCMHRYTQFWAIWG